MTGEQVEFIMWPLMSSTVLLCLLQDLVDFVSTAVSPKMQVLECMYIKQTIDLLQVRNAFVQVPLLLLFE